MKTSSNRRSAARKPARSKANKVASNRRATVPRKRQPEGRTLGRNLFAAAFSERTREGFARRCAAEVCAAMGAAEVVLALADGSAGELMLAATSEAACDLVRGSARRSPLAACLSSKEKAPVRRDRARALQKRHEQQAAEHGWRTAVCLPLYDTCGAVLGAIAFYYTGRCGRAEITKRFDRLARRALCDALSARQTVTDAVMPHQFSSLASTIPGVVYQRIVRMDGDIRYTYLSEGAREMFGVDPSEVLRDPEVLFSTYSEEYRQSFRARLVQASKTLTKWDVEATIDLPDGRQRTTHAMARPEPLADGSVLWTGVILDASRAKEAEESLKAANRLVGLANQAKSAFLAKMSHEMRTPLNGVLGMGDLLLKTDLSPRQTRLATTLCESAKSLLGIINDVLDISRIEAGQFKLDPQDFNLRHCVEDALELCSTAGYRKGLEVNLIIAPGTPVGVKSDPVRLRQVLINLIGNSIKFTETGEITVRLAPATLASGQTGVMFEVIDTGIGIDKEAIVRLFEPFAQADQTISRRFGGTGLGLSITRHLVELLGGTVSLSSEKGQGTIVRFALPFEVTAPAQTPSILNRIAIKGLRALVVDDRATTREMLASNLVEHGVEAMFATSETEALSLMTEAANANKAFDVMVVDRVRPRLSGLHLCRTLRSNPKLCETPAVAFMSANWNSNPVDQHGLGNTIVLSKPVRRTDLISALARSQDRDLDLGADEAETLSKAAQKRGVAPSLKLRVLLVEDNLTNIEVAREYLNELDCRVTVAMNGIEAIAAYDRSSFDVILMDTQMPELDGLSATRRIRESERTRENQRVPIIAVTANAYESDRAQALDAGSDDFLSKPFSDLQLRGMLQKWCQDGSKGQTPAPSQVAAVAALATTATDDKVLDEALHTVLLQSRPAFLGRLIRAFLSAVPETLTALRTAVAQSDPELLKSVAHSLKSSSANVGAMRLSETCRTLEMKLRLGADAADCDVLAASVAAELGRAEKALEVLLARLSGGDNSAAIRA